MTFPAGPRVRVGARLFVLLLVAALLLPVLPPLESSRAEEEPAGQACPEELVTEHLFSDIGGNTHEAAIACLVARGITRGTSPTTYEPAVVVRRDQMASFLLRLIEQLDVELPDPAVDFADVGASVHSEAIRRLATVGIVRGVSADSYEPARPVTRGQMATFLVRTVEYITAAELLSQPVGFVDIADSVHRANIQKVATVGIARGTSDTTYGPNLGVRRDQMASFLIRSLDRLLSPAEGLPELSLAVDPTLQPENAQLRVDEIEGTDAPRRPLAAIADSFGTRTDVVANELIVSAPLAELDRLLERWDAQIVLTVDPSDLDDSLDPIHLLRVEPVAVDIEVLTARLEAGPEPVFGAHRVSDEAVLGLLSMAADGTDEGLLVGLNPVQYPSADYIDGGFTESPTIAGSALTTTYNPDPATWPAFASGNNQDIGVVDAWRALALADRVDPPANNRIGIAILDGGFADLDLPPGSSGANNEPGLGKCSGEFCPWHGTSVAQVAAAVPGNGEFTAGSGGPVAAAMMYGVSLSLIDRLEISITAASPFAGPVFPRVLNMSFGGAVPRLLAIPLKPIVNGITTAISVGGTMIVASAGNEGQHVNRTECGWLTCYEVAQWLPCQASNVLCVGGLDTNSTSRHSSSNWGEDVRIFAPYWHYAGAESIVPFLYIEPPNEVRAIPGTSFSAPFVAGIGALVSAADRSLSGRQIRDLLLDTAVSSPHPQVTRIVQARTAVETAFGEEAFDHQITLPAEGAELVRGTTFNARTARSRPGLEVTWRLGGEVVGSGTTEIQQIPGTSFRELDPGTYELSATVSSGPYTLTRSISVEVVNEPPTVAIERPELGEEIYVTDPAVTFRARVTNPERTLDDDEVSWQVERPAGPQLLGTGRELSVPASVLGEGTWTVRATADDGIDTGSDTIEVEVLPEPVVPLPIVSITAPADGSFHAWQGLEGSIFYADVEFVASAVESASDATPLAGNRLSWSSTFQYEQSPDFPVQTETHGTGNPKVIRITTTGNCSIGTDHYVTVTATNSAGAERSATIRVWMTGPGC